MRHFKGFDKIEIQLRICRLLKVVDLTPYDGRIFGSKEEIEQEAAENLKKQKEGDLSRFGIAGGVVFNPPEREPPIPSNYGSKLF